jgi:hypothetical protein
MKTVAVVVVVAVLFVAPATAHADGPAPTVDQVVAIMAELTDPNIPAANKSNIVIPGFSPDEAGTDALRQPACHSAMTASDVDNSVSGTDARALHKSVRTRVVMRPK